MRRSLLTLVVLVAIFAPASALAEPPELPALPVETVVLANGLRVLLAPDPQATMVSVEVAYHAGMADDPNGRRGLAHLTEHLVGSHTKHVRAALRTLGSVGAINLNASTTLDGTYYFETVPPERLETALWVESDRMGYAGEAVSEARLVSERAAVHNEGQLRNEDASLGAAYGFAQRELYPAWHPYSVQTDTVEVDQIGAADVRAFLSTWYTPPNATLAIAGRFDRAQTLALVKRYFEPLAGPPPPSRPRLPPSKSPGVDLVVEANVIAEQVILEWRTAPYDTPADPALDLVAAVLAGPGNTRLQRSLLDTHLASSVTARQGSNRQASVFYVSATCAPGVDPSTLVIAITSTLEALGRDITASEVTRTREDMRFALLRNLEKVQGRASYLALHGRRGPVLDWGLARYDTLAERDVRNAVSIWLRPSLRVTTIVRLNRGAPARGILVSRTEVSP